MAPPRIPLQRHFRRRVGALAQGGRRRRVHRCRAGAAPPCLSSRPFSRAVPGRSAPRLRPERNMLLLWSSATGTQQHPLCGRSIGHPTTVWPVSSALGPGLRRRVRVSASRSRGPFRRDGGAQTHRQACGEVGKIQVLLRSRVNGLGALSAAQRASFPPSLAVIG